MEIQRKSEQQFRQLLSTATSESYSKSFVISENLKSEQLFLSYEIIRPQSRASSAHFHKETEEIIYVLKGELVAFEDDRGTLIQQGDSLLFRADSGKKHYLKNESESEAHVLVFRRQTKNSDVMF